MRCAETHLSLQRVGPHRARAGVVVRAVGIKIKEKLGCVLANAQIADGLSVLGVEVLAYCGVADVVFLIIFIQAFGNNS
jgi:hypothetical protein